MQFLFQNSSNTNHRFIFQDIPPVDHIPEPVQVERSATEEEQLQAARKTWGELLSYFNDLIGTTAEEAPSDSAPNSLNTNEGMRFATDVANTVAREEKSTLLANYGKILSPEQSEELWNIYVSLGDFVENNESFDLAPEQASLVACLYMFENSHSSEPIFDQTTRRKINDVRVLYGRLVARGWDPTPDTQRYETQERED